MEATSAQVLENHTALTCHGSACTPAIQRSSTLHRQEPSLNGFILKRQAALQSNSPIDTTDVARGPRMKFCSNQVLHCYFV